MNEYEVKTIIRYLPETFEQSEKVSENVYYEKVIAKTENLAKRDAYIRILMENDFLISHEFRYKQEVKLIKGVDKNENNKK